MDARDRHTGLIIFGILQIALGLLCAAAVLVVAAGEEIARRTFPDAPSTLASALIVYGTGAAYFITVGVGSIRGRRWSRALSIVVSALWTVAGVVVGLMTAVILPKFPVPHMAAVASGFAIFILLAGIALPLLIHFFYRREDVRLTVERLDAKSRWTDRVPLPILAVILVLAFGAVALIANLANPVLMLFGRPITGAPATMTQFAFAGLSAVLAVQLYRLKESAWWTLILLQIAGVIVAIAIIATTDGRATPPDIAQIYRDPLFIAVFAATWIGYFAFLVYLRRFFVLVPAPRTRRDD